ncbi:MAG: hypothetical protein ABJA02_16795 [Acidobacteriota bacterium]
MSELSHQKNYVTVGLIAIHMAVAIPLAYHLNIWSDEASTLYTTNNGLISAIHGALDNERQAPLYFAVLGLWRNVNHSIFFARLFSVGCSVLAVKLFADLVFRHFERRTAICAAVFFALHPFLFWSSLEIRTYSLVILLSVQLVNIFLRAFPAVDVQIDTGRKRSRSWFLIVAIISLYTNYYLGFILVGLFGTLVYRRQWRPAGAYLAFMSLAGFAFIPLAIVVAKQVAANTGGFQGDRTMSEGLRTLWHHTLTFILPAEVMPDQNTSPAAVLRLNIARVAAILISITVCFRWRRLSGQTISFGISAIIVGGLFLCAYLLLGENYVEIRHASVLFVPLILALSSGLSDLFSSDDLLYPRLSTWMLAACSFVILCFFAYSVFTLYPEMKKRGDWESVANYIETRESAGQPILVFTTYDALALKVYYRGINSVLPDRNYFDFDLEDKASSEKSLSKRIDFAISEIPADSTQIWLLESEKCMTTEACEPLENFVEANYTVIQQQDFYRERVRLLKRKTQ